jgi:hypothetical protein
MLPSTSNITHLQVLFVGSPQEEEGVGSDVTSKTHNNVRFGCDCFQGITSIGAEDQLNILIAISVETSYVYWYVIFCFCAAL